MQGTWACWNPEQSARAPGTANPSEATGNRGLRMFSALLTQDEPALVYNTFTDQQNHLRWTELNCNKKDLTKAPLRLKRGHN